MKKAKFCRSRVVELLLLLIGSLMLSSCSNGNENIVSITENAVIIVESTNDTANVSNTDNNVFAIDAEKIDGVTDDIIDDGIVDKLMEFGFSEEEAIETRKLFIMCGVHSIDECKPTDPNATIDGLVSFRAEWDKDRVFWFTVDNREVFYMSLNGTDVYDKDQGGFLINVNDVHVPESSMTFEEKEELRDLSESVLDTYFKHLPYYDGWGIARSDDDYMVKCEAYASNDLGMKDFVPAKVWFTKIEGEFVVTAVSINGIQYDVK